MLSTHQPTQQQLPIKPLSASFWFRATQSPHTHSHSNTHTHILYGTSTGHDPAKPSRKVSRFAIDAKDRQPGHHLRSFYLTSSASLGRHRTQKHPSKVRTTQLAINRKIEEKKTWRKSPNKSNTHQPVMGGGRWGEKYERTLQLIEANQACSIEHKPPPPHKVLEI